MLKQHARALQVIKPAITKMLVVRCWKVLVSGFDVSTDRQSSGHATTGKGWFAGTKFEGYKAPEQAPSKASDMSSLNYLVFLWSSAGGKQACW